MAAPSLIATLDPAILALLSATYGKPEAAEAAVARAERHAAKARAPRKASKLAALKASVEATPSPKAPPPLCSTTMDLPNVGTVTAKGFLRIVNRKDATVEDKIRAVAGFVGYDRFAPFGEQEYAARMQATRQMGRLVLPFPTIPGTVRAERPCGDSAVVHAPASARPTLSGFITGLPDDQAKRVANLLARERVAAEAMAEHEESAKDEDQEPSERAYHAQLALVELGRIQAIRADLAAMGVPLDK